MKIRCASCHKVVKVANPELGQIQHCPLCGASLNLSKPEAQIPAVVGSGQSDEIVKGALPTHNKGIEAVGCLVTVVVLSILAAVVRAASDSEVGVWIGAVVVVAITVAIGVWFHNRARS